MLKTISNAWISKKDTSINFLTNEDNFHWSGKKEIFVDKLGEDILNNLDYLKNKQIEINSENIYELRKNFNWKMVRDIEFLDHSKSNVIKTYHQFKNQKRQKANDVMSFIEEIEVPYEDMPKAFYFTPFQSKVIFNDSYQKWTWKSLITANTNSSTLNMCGEISVLQNFVNRGILVKHLKNNNASSVIISAILEVRKHHPHEKIYFTAHPQLQKNFEASLEELKALIEIYHKLFKNDIALFGDVQNIEFKKNEEEKDKIFLSLESISILEFQIMSSYDTNFKPVNFISSEFVLYNPLINSDNKPLTKTIMPLNKLLEVAFYEDKFKISKLKTEQVQALNSILIQKVNILTVLKTGYGKSLIYQFLSLLQPNLILAIFPILSLIDDQSFSLKKIYNLSYVVDNQELKQKTKNIINEKSFINNRLFLITPERIENEEFQQMIIRFSKFIGLMVFDEAHCISEWGHDFRPAYLVARHITENIKSKNENLKVIALTATAAPFVQRDISKNLFIPRQGVINIADTKEGLERKELTFNFQRLDIKGSLKDKWLQSIDKKIRKNKHLKGNQIYYFIRAGSNRSYKHISAFATYEHLLMSFPNISLGVFTGRTKLINESKNVSFNNYKKVKTIVSTKAFGMGINLEDCNYICFVELPPSLEDLYQQAGRAGRRGQNSNIDIMFSNSNLEDPIENELSTHNWLLKTNKKRITNQPILVLNLLKVIRKIKKSFKIQIQPFFDFYNIKYYDQNQEYLKFAISHLINEFKIIKFYTLKYHALKYYASFKIKEIKIHLNDGVSDEYINSKIDQIIENYSLNKKSDKEIDKVQVFYDWYFNEIQKQKIMGFNILRNRLKTIDTNSKTKHNKFIYEILNEYYKTKQEQVYTNIDTLFSALREQKSLSNIRQKIDNFIDDMGKDEFNENISRYQINEDYIKSLAIISYLDHSIKPLIGTIREIFNITNEYLVSLRNQIVEKAWDNISNLNEEVELSLITWIESLGGEQLINSYVINKSLERIVNEY